jgi:4-diphosphocytidyl-2-C-methyl-D-erythritol kinase
MAAAGFAPAAAAPLGAARLLRLAGALGSDVPFFLAGGPLALAWGRGERLLPLTPSPPATVVVAAPAEGMATAEAYARLAESRRAARHGTAVPEPLRLDPAALGTWPGLAALAVNDFEPLVTAAVPAAARALHALRAADAAPGLVTGSGSAVCGVFTGPDADGRASRAAEAAREAAPDAQVFVTGPA